ncbi:MAG: thymidine phosphorylase [Deltaproteobacteria bacterium]|nr:thymidine phosphorylase [Deltaproteobacteria bacterium]
MRAVDIIQKKRDGIPLNEAEINTLIQNFVRNLIPDYQMSAFLMACYFKPLSFQETVHLTKAMMQSGKILHLSFLPVPTVDKHSTGGVGDKLSLTLVPIVASYNIAVPMISGRALAHTGGTLDKLEAIPGFQVNLSLSQFKNFLKKSHMAMMGQTPEIAPADKKLYALRDVTATVPTLALICASIMSKKLAEGSESLVFDVKFGSGAFMKNLKEACELARWLVQIAKAFNRKSVALVTNMNEPVGSMVGNSLEIIESIEILKGRGPKDLIYLTLHLAAHMLLLTGRAQTKAEGIALAKEAIESGKALTKFKTLVQQQGGNPHIIDTYSLLPKARFQKEFQAPQNGYLCQINTETIGMAACLLGAGRETMEDSIDPAVGFQFHKKVGSPLQKGDSILTIYYNNEKKLSEVWKLLKMAFTIKSSKPKKMSIIAKIIE